MQEMCVCVCVFLCVLNDITNMNAKNSERGWEFLTRLQMLKDKTPQRSGAVN